MTTMSSTQRNGSSKRPSLSEQITRLDQMLDGLSEGLNDAVADAVKAAVGTAVQGAVHAVLTEVFTNPELLDKLRPPVPPIPPPPATQQPPARPTLWQRVGNCVTSIRDLCARGLDQMRDTVDVLCDQACERFLKLWGLCQMLGQFKYHILSALAVGGLVGVGVWFAGAWLGVVGSAIGGFVTTLGVQAGLWLCKLFTPGSEQLA